MSLNIEVVGTGAVAQLLCRELVAGGNHVGLHVPKRSRGGQQQAQTITELMALPWMQGVIADLDAPAGLRMFAGTPEQFWAYQKSQHHQTARSPVLLLTSWWENLNALQGKLHGAVLTVYPRVTVESWQGRLAVVGTLQLELARDCCPSTVNLTAITAALDACGLAWELRPMQNRFEALFARTRFAYWYLVNCLEPTEKGDEPASRAVVKMQWNRIQPLLAFEQDLQLPLEMMELAIALMRKGDPKHSDPAWILDVLLNHKRGQIDYFLRRQERLTQC